MFDSLFIILPFILVFAFTVETNYKMLTESESIDSAEQAAIAISYLPEGNEKDLAEKVYSVGMNEPNISNIVTSTNYLSGGYQHSLVKLNVTPAEYLPFSSLTSLKEDSMQSVGHYIKKHDGDSTKVSDVTIVLNTGYNYDTPGSFQSLPVLKKIIFEWSRDHLLNDRHPDSRFTFLTVKQRTYDARYGCVSKIIYKPQSKSNIHFNEWYKSGLHLNTNPAENMRAILMGGTLGNFSDEEIETIADEATNFKPVLDQAASATGNGVLVGDVDFDATIKHVFDANPRKEVDGQTVYGSAIQSDTLINNFENFISYNTCREPQIGGSLYPVNSLVVPPVITVDEQSIDDLQTTMDNVPDKYELGVNPIEGILKGAETLHSDNDKASKHKKLLVYIGPVRGSNDAESLLSNFTSSGFCKKLADKFQAEDMGFQLVFLATGNGGNEHTSTGMDKCMEDYNAKNFYVLNGPLSEDEMQNKINKILDEYIN